MSERATIALVTGAAGGIGSACAALLGRVHRVFLSDIDSGRLDQVAAKLEAEGVTVAGRLAVDLAVGDNAALLIETVRALGPIGAVVHTAGLSPALGNAEAVMRANACATEALMVALETALEPGTNVVLIASMAGHVASPDADIDRLCADPLARGFMQNVLPLLGAKTSGGSVRELSATAYTYSKRANILSAQRRCAAWAAQGARIVSISPGLVDTAMGRSEVETDPSAAAMLGMTPLGWVQPADIAEAAAFLLSPAARTISGCDLKVDGGVCAAIFQGQTTTGSYVA